MHTTMALGSKYTGTRMKWVSCEGQTYSGSAVQMPAMVGTRDSSSRFQQQLAVVTAGARMPHHQSQFGFDGHVSPQHYAAMAHRVDSYDLAAYHLVQGGFTQ
ncbi:uncharacterized protein LOC124664949 [Lolium rigidum]|uniref:uncharacterized protein LOC124664949 n=1 Tax=Lolium rigidum TaxID=89674 RepID=UPI001F5D6514|nr:uncharacterized protein LOC124664949 [Lolium rigidum]